MATQWGRKETIIWPPHVPMLSYTAVCDGPTMHLPVRLAAASRFR